MVRCEGLFAKTPNARFVSVGIRSANVSAANDNLKLARSSEKPLEVPNEQPVEIESEIVAKTSWFLNMAVRLRGNGVYRMTNNELRSFVIAYRDASANLSFIRSQKIPAARITSYEVALEHQTEIMAAIHFDEMAKQFGVALDAELYVRPLLAQLLEGIAQRVASVLNGINSETVSTKSFGERTAHFEGFRTLFAGQLNDLALQLSRMRSLMSSRTPRYDVDRAKLIARDINAALLANPMVRATIHEAALLEKVPGTFCGDPRGGAPWY